MIIYIYIYIYIYIGSSVESTESDCIYIYIYIYETQFLPGSGHIDTAIWMHYMDANKTAGEETRWQYPGSNTPQGTNYIYIGILQSSKIRNREQFHRDDQIFQNSNI